MFGDLEGVLVRGGNQCLERVRLGWEKGVFNPFDWINVIHDFVE